MKREGNLSFFVPLQMIPYEGKIRRQYAPVAESADATDSKSVGGDTMWVQVPPGAPYNQKEQDFAESEVFFCAVMSVFCGDSRSLCQ